MHVPTAPDLRGRICRADLPELLRLAGRTRLWPGETPDDLRDALIAEDVRMRREDLPTWHPLSTREDREEAPTR